MKKHTDTGHRPQAPSKSQVEEERDNDAHRPDGSSGTDHDSTAQKTARNNKGEKKH